jgi:hypothetical protein
MSSFHLAHKMNTSTGNNFKAMMYDAGLRLMPARRSCGAVRWTGFEASE